MTDNSVITKKKPKPIGCNKHLIAYLKETLRLEKVKLKKKEGGKITATDLRDIAYNDDTKLAVLNKYIFPSMANLIYFFEFLNNNHELIDKFDEDVLDLFGLRAHTDPKFFTFPRFVRAVIGEGHPDYDNVKFNYRRRLLKIMQYSINQKAMLLVAYSKNDPLGYNDTRFRDMIISDLQKAEVWMNYLDRFTGNEMKESSRLIDV
jgi:hypothetical protein